MLLFAFLMSWALIGAYQEIRRDAGTEFHQARARAQARFRRHVADVRARHAITHPRRLALETAIGCYVVSRGAARTGRYAFRSARRGWARGWADGRERHASYVARKRGATQTSEVTPAQNAEPAAAPMPPDAVRTDPHSNGQHPAQPAPTSDSRTESATGSARTDAGHTADDPPPPTPGGTPVPTATATSGEAPNIEAARIALQAINQTADQTVAAIDNLSASLADADMDPATLGEVADILDAANALQAAAGKALSGMNQRHAVVEEAINSTPHVAKTEFYQH
jgi:hypothetical protein